MNKRLFGVASVFLIWALVFTAHAGPLLVDKPIRAGGLWCLQDSANPLQFRYLPSSARLAKRPDGTPLFSLVYYSEPQTGGDALSSVEQSEGGALLNFMVEYFTPQQQIKRAEYALRQLVDEESRLLGPVVFDDGTYTLVSSTVSDAGVRFSDGKAPVLSSSRVAISVRLDSRTARLLDAALQSNTPDLSLVFDMVYSGVRSKFDADIIVDWQKASDSLDRGLKAGVSVYGIGVGGEIEQAVTDMLNNGAIKVDVRGSDESMEAMIADIQEAATELFFTPLEDVEADDNFGKVGLPEIPAGGGANRYFSINAQVKYKVKKIRTSGTTVIQLSKAAAATRRWSIVFDAGEIAANLVNNPAFVRNEDLSQRSMSVRNLVIKPDLELQNSFADIARSVDIEIVKTHADGRETFRQAHLSHDDVAQGKVAQVSYPRFAQESWQDWLSYRYRTQWVLRDDRKFTTDWNTVRAPEINLQVPLRSATIYPLGEMNTLRDHGVQAVIIEVSYPLFSDRQRTVKSVTTSQTAFPEFTVMVPTDHQEFTYTVTQIFAQGRRESYVTQDRAGFVSFDRMPVEPSEDSQPMN